MKSKMKGLIPDHDVEGPTRRRTLPWCPSPSLGLLWSPPPGTERKNCDCWNLSIGEDRERRIPALYHLVCHAYHCLKFFQLLVNFVVQQPQVSLKGRGRLLHFLKPKLQELNLKKVKKRVTALKFGMAVRGTM